MIQNTVENMTATLSLVQVEQDGARIRGFYTIENCIQLIIIITLCNQGNLLIVDILLGK